MSTTSIDVYRHEYNLRCPPAQGKRWARTPTEREISRSWLTYEQRKSVPQVWHCFRPQPASNNYWVDSPYTALCDHAEELRDGDFRAKPNSKGKVCPICELYAPLDLIGLRIAHAAKRVREAEQDRDKILKQKQQVIDRRQKELDRLQALYQEGKTESEEET